MKTAGRLSKKWIIVIISGIVAILAITGIAIAINGSSGNMSNSSVTLNKTAKWTNDEKTKA